MKKNIAKLLVFAMLLSLLPFTVAAEAKVESLALNEYVTVKDVQVTGITAKAEGAKDEQGAYTFTADTTAKATVTDGKAHIKFTMEVAENVTALPTVTCVESPITPTGAASPYTVECDVAVNTKEAAQTAAFTISTKSAAGDKTASFTLKFNIEPTSDVVAVESVTVAPKTLELVVGGTGELKATVLPDGATDKTMTWTSSNEEVATVDENGKVTAAGVGEATITVTAGEKTDTCKVTVKAAAVKEVAKPSVDVAADIPDGADEQVTNTINSAVDAIKAVTDTTPEAVAPDLSNTILNTTQKDEDGTLTFTGGERVEGSEIGAKTADLRKKDGVAADATINTIVEPKIDIKPSDATVENGKVTTLTFTITASASVSVTTADTKAEMTEANSVHVKDVPLDKTDEEVPLVLPLPEAVRSSLDGDKLVVKHKKADGRIFWHIATLIEKGASFVNRHGFSDFTLLSTNDVAAIDEETYPTLQAAIDKVNNNETITLLKDALTAKVAREITFKLELAEGVNTGATIEVGEGYYDATEKDGNLCTIRKRTSGGGSGGGGGGSSKPAIKPGEKPTTPGTTAPSGGVAGFTDVATSAWYADAVQYVVDKGLFGGVGNGNFAPNANMTRAMMWTVLARYKGVNTNTGSNWYEAARTWAIAQGISDGTMADGNVTREQFVTMLWRLSGEPTVTNSATFTDAGKVSDYAKAAVNWAVSKGIVNGYNDGSFKPQGSATRAEVAKMLTVFCEDDGQTTTTETTTDTTTTDTTTDTPKDANGASLGEG